MGARAGPGGEEPSGWEGAEQKVNWDKIFDMHKPSNAFFGILEM